MDERPDILTNPRADRVRQVAGLSGRSARLRHRQFLVEGPGPVRELLAHAPQLVRDLYVTQPMATREAPTVARARRAGRWVHLVSREVADAMSGDAQGILAVATLPEPATLEVLTGARLVLLLPQVSDPGNAGTLIRIADAAGAGAVVICRGGVEPTAPKVVRASAGSLFHLPVVTGVTWDAALAAARARGLWVLGADAAGSVDVLRAGAELARPTAWVFGNEAHGLGAVRADCDAVASVPIFGRAESLNVAAAAAVCLYASAAALAR